MNSLFHSLVSNMVNRTVSSWDRASACGHSEEQRELARRAPHAPCESQSHFVCGELRAKIRTTTSDRDVLKRLELGTSEGKYLAVKASSKVSNRPDRSASEHTHMNHVPGRMWDDRVGELNCVARIHHMLGIDECLIETILKYKIRAQLRFLMLANDQQSRLPRGVNPQQIHRTIGIHRLERGSAIACCNCTRTSISAHWLARNYARRAVN